MKPNVRIRKQAHIKCILAGRALVLLLSAALYICAPLTSARSEERCGIPSEVDQLIDTMSMIASMDGPISINTRATLNFQLNRAAQLMAKDATSDLGLGGWKSSFDWVFARGKETLAAGQMSDPDKTHNRIGTLAAGLRFICDARITRGNKLATNSDASAAEDENNAKGNSHLSPVHAGSTRQLVTIFLAAILLISVIWGGNIAYKSIYALLNNRRSCHIYGALEIGLDVIDGAIVILGAKGARFRPVNDGAFDRIVKLVDPEKPMVFPPVIQIGEDRFAVEITALVDGHASCFFCEPIDLKRQNELLEGSTVKPRYAPQKIPKRNIGHPTGAIEEAEAARDKLQLAAGLEEGNIFGFDFESTDPTGMSSEDLVAGSAPPNESAETTSPTPPEPKLR